MIGQCDNSVLLYDTTDSGDMESAYCMYHLEFSEIKYCIRWNTSVSLVKNTTSCLHGKKWNFTELLAKRISPWEILSWSSGVEKADDYARVFYNHSETLGEDPFLCNCTKGYFGEQCEYTLLADTASFSSAIETLFGRHIDRFDHQKWGKILCYETLTCNSGMLCLDWRNICDRLQNCMNGIDEENCDLLEFNECEENEYRCLDGTCIAEEYWLDGKFNCA
jgi:hypothetical protein